MSRDFLKRSAVFRDFHIESRVMLVNVDEIAELVVDYGDRPEEGDPEVRLTLHNGSSFSVEGSLDEILSKIDEADTNSKENTSGIVTRVENMIPSRKKDGSA